VTARGRAHRIVGILGVLAFLASGLDMHFRHDHLRGLDMATRLSFRSIHIYLLFSALLNLGFAYGERVHDVKWRARVAAIGSGFVLIAPLLLGIAFVKEPLESVEHRAFTSFGVYASVLGTVLLTIASASRTRR
jgi:undecaprenyl pyrophosphate phosphatase UppP